MNMTQQARKDKNGTDQLKVLPKINDYILDYLDRDVS